MVECVENCRLEVLQFAQVGAAADLSDGDLNLDEPRRPVEDPDADARDALSDHLDDVMGANAPQVGSKADTAAARGPPPPPKRPKRHGGRQSQINRDIRRQAERDARDRAGGAKEDF